MRADKGTTEVKMDNMMMETQISAENIDKWKHLFLLSKFGIDEIETKLNILNEEYHFLHDYNPIEHITTRVKDPQQIVKKLIKGGHAPNVENAEKYVHDIGGVRVICSFAKDVYTVARMLEQQSDVTVIKVKDYIANPKPNGYRSLHMLIEIPIFLSNEVKNVITEVQFRSISMDLWASIEHKIYYKSAINIPKELENRLTRCADKLDEIDLEMHNIKEEIKKYM